MNQNSQSTYIFWLNNNSLCKFCLPGSSLTGLTGFLGAMSPSSLNKGGVRVSGIMSSGSSPGKLFVGVVGLTAGDVGVFGRGLTGK